MPTRRMLIEDYELMGHARRAYLAWLDSQASQGIELSAGERQRQRVLRDDTRLESPLLMNWELKPEFDGAIIDALAFIRERVSDELAPQGIPAEDLDRYIEYRKTAIDRVIARLRGEI